jgi:hypothetical protein
VVAHRRLGARLVTTPSRVVAVGELSARTLLISVVAESKDRPFDAVEQVGCGLVTGATAAGDVARPDQDRIALG